MPEPKVSLALELDMEDAYLLSCYLTQVLRQKAATALISAVHPQQVSKLTTAVRLLGALTGALNKGRWVAGDVRPTIAVPAYEDTAQGADPALDAA